LDADDLLWTKMIKLRKKKERKKERKKELGITKRFFNLPYIDKADDWNILEVSQS
jgi:hypothetical protein